MQPMDEPLVLVLPDASKAPQDVLQCTAWHAREHGLQRRYIDVGSGQTEQLNNLIAQQAGRTTDGATSGVRRELAFTRSLMPIAQGPRRDAQATGCVRGGDAKSCRPVAEVEDHVAGLVFRFTARVLAGRTPSARRQRGRVGLVQ